MDFNENHDDFAVEQVIHHVMSGIARKYSLTNKERKQFCQEAFNALRRFDILQPLIEDPAITEIMINGYNKIFVEEEGHVHLLKEQFRSKEALEDIIQRMVSKVNRVVNESNPVVDARLEDGSRIHVVLPPLALNGPILTIRKFAKESITMEQLVTWGSISSGAADFLRILVEAKYNIFVCGGTGSGKTTFLNVLSNYIPKEERLITIEDSAELQIKSLENLVQLETRNANVEGKGQVKIRDLIKASLRMRPDRIVVGEVRGEEALDMLQAMNTGHDGSLSTGHANSCKDMLSRLETMVLTGAEIPLQAIRQQIASAIDIMVYLGRLRDGSRRVLEIVEVLGYKDQHIELATLYSFIEDKESQKDCVYGCLKETDVKLQHDYKCKMAGLNLREESL